VGEFWWLVAALEALKSNEKTTYVVDGSRKYILKYSAYANALAHGSRVVGKIEEAQGQGS
jgi:hypothetical protein